VPEQPVAVAPGKKGKGAKKAASKGKSHKAAASIIDDGDAPCGFDIRLVWDDPDWETWIATGELEREEARPTVADETVVCVVPRKACDRHQGWQRLHEASFEAEKAGQVRAAACMLGDQA
jgi:COMPASS component SPP1